MIQALWARVYADPSDDEARRVLADALLEKGDPRGELIAVQCELARTEEDERGPREAKLVERERALLTAHGDEWTEGWPFELKPHFIRGFPERQHANAADVIRHAAAAFRLAPTLREVVFTDEEPRRWTGGFNAFCVSPHAARFEKLTLPITFQPGDLSALATIAPKALVFTGGSMGDIGVLQRLPLTELAFEFDVVGVRDLAPLIPLPMRSFINRGNEVPVVPAWPKLERLTLDRVSTRVHLSRWPELRRLELFDTKLGRRGVRELLEQGHPKVRRLGLRGERLDADAGALLLERWPALEVLDVRGCASAVVDRPGLLLLR